MSAKKYFKRFKLLSFIYVLSLSLIFNSCLMINSKTLYTNNEYLNYYKNEIPNNETMLRAGYIFVLSKDNNGNYVYSTFFPETKTLLTRTVYKDMDLTIPIGKYNAYHWESGNLKEEGQYDEYGNKIGDWKKYSDGGFLTSHFKYVNNKIEGEAFNYFDSTNLQVFQKMLYKNDKIQGEVISFDKKGEQEKKEFYNNGELIRTEHLSPYIFRNAQFYEPNCENLDSLSNFNCSINNLMKFLSKNIKYPAKARLNGAEGKNLVKFIVDKDGSLKDIEIYDAICQPMNDEIYRLFSIMPKWKPGTKNGEPVKTHFLLPIQFKLQ